MPSAIWAAVIFTAAAGRILILSISFLFPLSVVTTADLKRVPNLFARSTLTLMTPVEPRGIVQGTGGSWAVVQLHDPFALKIVTLSPEIFVKLNVKRAKTWPSTASTVLNKPSHANIPSGNGSPAWE